MKRLYICIYFLTSFCVKNIVAQTNSGVQKINAKITQLKESSLFSNASFSVTILDCNTDEIITGINNHQRLSPASSLKVVTCATALTSLGKDFKFKTYLEYDGIFDSSGTLHGNIYIRGNGDPTFGSDRYDSLTSYQRIYNTWLTKLKLLGIQKVDGRVMADATIFDNESIADGWQWEDIANGYGAGANGLTFLENSYDLFLCAGNKIGDKTSFVKTIPALPFFTFDNQVTTAESKTGDETIIYGAPSSTIREIKGTIPLGKKEFKIKGALPDPPLLCVTLFEKFLKENQIQITHQPEVIKRNLPDSISHSTLSHIISIHYSPTLEMIVNETMTHSINTYAEDILKYLGTLNNSVGTRKSGIQYIESFWKSKGVNLNGFEISDGCGLSRKNQLTSFQLAEILAKASKEKEFQTFYNSLPELNSSKNKFNIRAKSGSMSQIRSYAGYFKNKNNKLYSFAVIINNYTTDKYKIREELKNLICLFPEIE